MYQPFPAAAATAAAEALKQISCGGCAIPVTDGWYLQELEKLNLCVTSSSCVIIFYG